MSPWTHALCSACWVRDHPAQPPYQVRDAESDVCCRCGAATVAGIYVREDPATLPCGGTHP